MSNKSKLISATLALLLASVGGGYFYMQSKSAEAASEKTSADANKSAKKDSKEGGKESGKSGGKDGNDKNSKDKDDKPLELAKADLTYVASRDLGAQILLSGTVRPVNQATIKSRVSAEVKQVHIKEGERVTKGQVLYTLDSIDWRNRVAQQQAQLDEARARLALAQKNQGTNQALRDKGFISQNALDTTSNSVEVAQASVKSAQAALELSRRQLDETSVRAPIAGIVAKRHAQAGEKITEQQSVAHIVDLTQMELEAQVPLAEIAAVKPGAEVQFKVDGFDNREFKGTVERINPAAEAGTRSIMLYVRVPNGDSSLRGGMYASGRLKATGVGTVNSLPLTALHDEAGTTFVYAVNDGKVQRVPVDVGQRNADVGMFELKSALDGKLPVINVKSSGIKHDQKAVVKG
jgi:membrane fusion protein, multidrug efflux system